MNTYIYVTQGAAGHYQTYYFYQHEATGRTPDLADVNDISAERLNDGLYVFGKLRYNPRQGRKLQLP